MYALSNVPKSPRKKGEIPPPKNRSKRKGEILLQPLDFAFMVLTFENRNNTSTLINPKIPIISVYQKIENIFVNIFHVFFRI